MEKAVVITEDAGDEAKVKEMREVEAVKEAATCKEVVQETTAADDDDSTPVALQRSPSPKVVTHKMELAPHFATSNDHQEIGEDWELWE